MIEKTFSIGLNYGLYGGVKTIYILFLVQYSYNSFVLCTFKLSITIYLKSYYLSYFIKLLNILEFIVVLYRLILFILFFVIDIITLYSFL